MGRASERRMMTMKNDDDHRLIYDFILDIMNLELEVSEGCIHHHDHQGVRELYCYHSGSRNKTCNSIPAW
jgi:hypothetical protein